VALAIGIGAAAVGTLCLIPALVHLFDLRIQTRAHPLLTRAAMIGIRTASHPWRVIGATAVLVGLAVPGIFRIAVETDTLAYFAADNRVRVGGKFFQDHLSSGFVLNVVLRGREPGRALDPDVLELAQRIETDVGSIPQVDRTISMLDYFAMMDAALHPDSEPRATPGSREAAAQYLLLYESSGDPDDFARYINYDRSALSMLVHVHDGSRMFGETAARVDKVAASAPPDIEVTSLGSAYLYTRAMEALTHGMVLGLTTTAILIGVVMVVGLRSFGLAFIAALPNLTPIVIWAGLLGWFDIPLSMGTRLVGCVALGLAVDDTAHVMGHVSRQHSLEQTYRLVGQPVVLTTVALGCGFSTLMLSEFQTIAAFGAGTAFTLVVALLADVILLPALLAVAGYRVRGDASAMRPREDAGRAEAVAERPDVRGVA
jgi:predicted RND superfamily exporter protein